MTLSHEKGRLSDLTIGLCGDMKNGRTVHSLVKALSKYKNNKFVMISTPELQMPEYIIDILKKSGCEYSFSSSLEEAISSLDVLYMTRSALNPKRNMSAKRAFMCLMRKK